MSNYIPYRIVLYSYAEKTKKWLWRCVSWFAGYIDIIQLLTSVVWCHVSLLLNCFLPGILIQFILEWLLVCLVCQCTACLVGFLWSYLSWLTWWVCSSLKGRFWKVISHCTPVSFVNFFSLSFTFLMASNCATVFHTNWI